MVTEKTRKPKSTLAKILLWSGAALLSGCLLFCLFTTAKVLHARRIDRSDVERIGGRNYRWVVLPSDGDSLAVYKDMRGRRGYLNTHTGRRVIQGPFRHAWVFSEGLAAVVGKDGRMGFIGRDGSYVIPPAFDCDPDEVYLFRNGYCWIQDAAGRWGAIDRSGRWALEPQFDYVWDYADNAYIVREESRRYGLMGLDLDWLLPPEYDDLDICSESDSTAYVTRDHIKSLVSYRGEVIEPFVYDYITTLTYDVEGEDESVNAPYLKFGVHDRCGVLSAVSGKIILPPVFENIDMVSATLFSCTLDDECYEEALYDIKGQPLGDALRRQLLD